MGEQFWFWLCVLSPFIGVIALIDAIRTRKAVKEYLESREVRRD